MVYWTIRWILISLVLIFLLHYLYTFFKTTLTVPKIRDLVNKPTEKYNEMLNTINNSDKIELEEPNKEEMQEELQHFLQDLKRPEKKIIPSNELAEGGGAFSNY